MSDAEFDLCSTDVSSRLGQYHARSAEKNIKNESNANKDSLFYNPSFLHDFHNRSAAQNKYASPINEVLAEMINKPAATAVTNNAPVGNPVTNPIANLDVSKDTVQPGTSGDANAVKVPAKKKDLDAPKPEVWGYIVAGVATAFFIGFLIFLLVKIWNAGSVVSNDWNWVKTSVFVFGIITIGPLVSSIVITWIAATNANRD